MKPSMKSPDVQREPGTSLQWSVSLALRSTAALGRNRGGGGTGFVSAASIAPLRQEHVSKGSFGLARWAVAHGRLPNTSVKRTHNSGRRWYASARPVTLLCAAYLIR
jgi:hypothetical protein